MTIGNASKMVDKGNWQTFPQPKLPKSLKEYDKLYTFGFQFKGFKFLCNLLKDKTNYDLCWFIYPFNKDFDRKIIVFSDVIKTSELWQRDIYNISIKNDKLKNLFMTFKENKIFYSSDLCRNGFQTSN